MNKQEDVFGITEDRIVERLLDRLNEGVVPSNAAREREAQVRLHEYTELLGLIPYELEPLAPPAGVREKLLRGVRVEEVEPVDPIPMRRSSRYRLRVG
jgi:hypothetical protein